MGILDDAIREHLDLKRQHGAQDSEVKQLEDEAFGPPTRPGEPDFPESQEQPAVETATTGPAAIAASEDATTVMGSAAAPEAPAAPPEPASAPPEEAVAEAPPETPPETVPDSPPEAPTEPPDEEPESPPEPPSEPAPEPALGAPGLFDQASEGAAEPPPAPPAEPPAAPPAEPPLGEEEARITPLPEPVAEEHPVTAMETVEHPMDELLADEAAVDLPQPDAPATGETDVVHEEGADEHLEPAPPPATGEEPVVEHADEEDPEGEDVLEETPEFLRDQPEDDELWFEQGEPKDFDF